MKCCEDYHSELHQMQKFDLVEVKLEYLMELIKNVTTVCTKARTHNRDLHSIKSLTKEEYASRVRVQITLECRRKADHAHNADSFKLVAGAFHKPTTTPCSQPL